MSEAQTIHWFPGHMTRTKRQIEKSLKMVDIVAEILDARIPVSSRNPILGKLIGNKPRLILMNKSDMADSAATARWIAYYKEKGIKAMQDAADPTLPHTYAWFVITDCNTQAEQFHRDLTLPDAIRIYSSSDRPEKRIGVTKDGIATVDLVHAQDGEQRFFEDYQKMNSFQNDPKILEAVDRLRDELELPNQGMSMGGM